MRAPISIILTPRHFASPAQLAAHLRLLGATDVLLYGSVARDAARPDSDIDIAVFGPPRAMAFIDRAYGFSYPVTVVDGVNRPTQIVTPAVTNMTVDQFRQCQPEALPL